MVRFVRRRINSMYLFTLHIREYILCMCMRNVYGKAVITDTGQAEH